MNLGTLERDEGGALLEMVDVRLSAVRAELCQHEMSPAFQPHFISNRINVKSFGPSVS